MAHSTTWPKRILEMASQDWAVGILWPAAEAVPTAARRGCPQGVGAEPVGPRFEGFRGGGGELCFGSVGELAEAVFEDALEEFATQPVRL